MNFFNTNAIHVGQGFDPTTGAIIPPIYQTSTFVQNGIGNLRGGFEYSRSANPTRSSLQEVIAALEGGKKAFSFASGLAAVDAILRTALRPGDHVLLSNDVYGGTYRLLKRVFAEWGVTSETVDMTDLAEVKDALTQKAPRVLWVETPSNPTMKISDIAALAQLGHQVNAIVVVDNTFASPALQQPLALGADVVMHSTTKYLGGHSDVLGGALVINDEELAGKVGFTQLAAGAVSGPQDAWLTVRGIKTLGVRMQQHSRNAQDVAEFLTGHDAIETIYYPGLSTHPGHELAKSQMSGFGGMLSMTFAAGPEAARKFAESTQLFQLAESLGGVESMIAYPSSMSHASMRGTKLAVPENLVRLSVGIEDIRDLLADIEQSLKGI